MPDLVLDDEEERFVACHGDRHDWDFKDPNGGGILLVDVKQGKKVTMVRREVKCRECGTMRKTRFTYPDCEQFGEHRYEYPKGYLSKDHPGRGIVSRGEWVHVLVAAMPIVERR